MDDGIEILKHLLKWHSSGKQVALATVVKTWGSAPRRTGAMMCINSTMQFQGSVSGGCVETAVIDQALNVINSRQKQLLDFGVSNEQAWEVGLACGGNIEILVESITDEHIKTISTIIDLVATNKSAILLRELDHNDLFEVIVNEQVNDCHLFDPSERILLGKSLLQDRPLVIANKQGRYFIHPFNPQLKLYIVGAVHIAQQLVQMVNALGFKVYVVDPRAAFATEERFKHVELITQWPGKVFPELELNHRTAIIALSHDPKFDDPAISAALNSSAFYIGALGSRKTHASRLERLGEDGFDPQQLSRIHAPVGLDINASNPAEIAVSIAAELVSQLRKHE